MIDLHYFLRMSPVDVARSSSDGVAIRYVLPVLWMTSHSDVMDPADERLELSTPNSIDL